METGKMLEKMKSLPRKKDMCVLATTSQGKPHCSLMAYAINDDYREVYMVTHPTKKYSNILENPSVSLLVDTRGDYSPAPMRGSSLSILKITRNFDPF